VFEYVYRDAGNWKTHGALLLIGEAQDMREAIRSCLESGYLFVAEQAAVPSLCEQHFIDCQDGPSDLDHAYHEFVGLRLATDVEAATLQPWGTIDELILRMQSASGRWDVSLSPNVCLSSPAW
jgi:hypothetical protein